MCAYGNCRNEFLVIINGYVEFNPTVRGLKYAIFKSSGMSQTKTRCRYRFGTLQVEENIKEFQHTRESTAKIEDKSFLQRFGVQIADSNVSESATDYSSGEEDSLASSEDFIASPLESHGLTPQVLRNLTSQANYNFFHLLQ